MSTEINKERVEELAKENYPGKEKKAGDHGVIVRKCRKAFIKGFKAGYSTSQAQWQLCPKCLGNGWTPTTGGYQTATTQQCDVCYGNKIIAPPSSIYTRGEDAGGLEAELFKYLKQSIDETEGIYGQVEKISKYGGSIFAKFKDRKCYRLQWQLYNQDTVTLDSTRPNPSSSPSK